MWLNLLLILCFDFSRDYEWCDQEGKEEGRMEGKMCTLRDNILKTNFWDLCKPVMAKIEHLCAMNWQIYLNSKIQQQGEDIIRQDKNIRRQR